jgi:hypothetical protein
MAPGNILILSVVLLANILGAQCFLLDSTTPVANVGNHGNSPNTWESIVLAKLLTLDIKSSTCESTVATLNREFGILGLEMIKVNATVNDNSK